MENSLSLRQLHFPALKSLPGAASFSKFSSKSADHTILPPGKRVAIGTCFLSLQIGSQ